MSLFSSFILVSFCLPESKLEKHNNVGQACQPPLKKAVSCNHCFLKGGAATCSHTFAKEMTPSLGKCR